MCSAYKSPGRKNALRNKDLQHPTPLAKWVSRMGSFDWPSLCELQFRRRFTLPFVFTSSTWRPPVHYASCTARALWRRDSSYRWRRVGSAPSRNGTELVNLFIRHLANPIALTLPVLPLIRWMYTLPYFRFTLQATRIAQNCSSPIQQGLVRPPRFYNNN